MPQPHHIIMLATYPPRRCGIATFAQDSLHALTDNCPDLSIDVIAMDDGGGHDYPPEVLLTLPADDLKAYRAAAERINRMKPDLVWIHHEFGIFGGPSGSYLLEFVNTLDAPLAVTLHSVLADPDPDQETVMQALLDRAGQVIVMAEKAREILFNRYPHAGGKVAVIEHGVPDRPLVPTDEAKAALALPSAPLIMTFGLLSPDKGISDMVEALPHILAQCPRAQYLVVGQTHPHVRAIHGESYRQSLIDRAAELGVSHGLSFVNRFVSLDELTAYLAATDVYVTPYRNPAQITSGTLSYAIGMGKPVVSTPYAHASELLADGIGSLVDFGDTEALQRSVSGLLTDDIARLAMARRAWQRGRQMIWPLYARKIMDIFGALSVAPRRQPPLSMMARPQQPPLPEALDRMTSGGGMFQHCRHLEPDLDHGYCVDDNARALMLMSMADEMALPRRLAFSQIYALFVERAWNDDARAFRNFMSTQGEWLEEKGSEDSNGRTLWCLGVVSSRHPDRDLRQWADGLFHSASLAMAPLSSPRARAFAILGAVANTRGNRHRARTAPQARSYAVQLMESLAQNRASGHPWFERYLAYDNARLPQALIEAGHHFGDLPMLNAGLRALRWLCRIQTSEAGHFRPVPTVAFGVTGRVHSLFDQQPVDAWATIDACASACRITGESFWSDEATKAWQWFLGKNDHGLSLVTHDDGCFDGLTPEGLNLNSGAESILSWQISRQIWRGLDQDCATGKRAAA